MVLESVTNPFRAERHPGIIFLIGFLYTSIAVVLSMWIFHAEASLVMVFLATMAALPLMYNTIKVEEGKSKVIPSEWALLKEHGKALSFFMYLFVGSVLAFAVWYVALPSDFIQHGFSAQTQTLIDINNLASAKVTYKMTIFNKIFFNNLRVLLFAILFSFIYGAGAIFILTWNASVIGVAIGNFIRTNLETYTAAVGLAKLSGYFHVISIGLLRYTLHGIPEILAYFVGGLAGGIISVAVIRHDYTDKNFQRIILDSSDLLLIALGLLLVAALLEVFVTPLIF